MIQQPLPSPINVAANQIATVRVPRQNLTLLGLLLSLGGTTFNTGLINFVRMKCGPRTMWEITGAELLAINAYKNEGLASNAFLFIDFAERDDFAAPFVFKEIGGYDLGVIGDLLGEVIFEIGIGAATAPTLEAEAFFNGPQGNPVVQKYVKFITPTVAAGRFTLPLDFRGASVERMYIRYAGTDWTTTANGNVNRVEIKRNGLVVYDMSCLKSRQLQLKNQRVPQSRTFVADFKANRDPDGNLRTIDKIGDRIVPAVIEVNTYLTAADSMAVIAECLDAPGNL